MVKNHLKNMISKGVIVKSTTVKSNDEKGPKALHTVSYRVERHPQPEAQVSLRESVVIEGSCTSQRSTVGMGSEGGSKRKAANAYEKPTSVNASLYEKRMAQTIRLAMLTRCVVCLFVLCWLPHLVMLVVILYCDEDRCPGKGYAQTITSMIIMLNSLMNVVVYTVKHQAFRSELKQIFCKRCDQK